MRQGLLIILLTISSVAHGQLTNFSEVWRSQEYKGDKFFSQGLYESAIKSYMKEIEKNKINARATAASAAARTMTKMATTCPEMGESGALAAGK